ncbi:uncharacterized protein LOC112686496 isoform X2 [Sipha flava]|uniref:Uncharacterized protein LOC112686496 isoform X2 n=1 Tax=Sipha flava TaxID=143950 RepID=A0A8B8FUB8_9HEMI|nr:uncharacterized protein LOC112686496 isoform X2 [Sipha flava]
MKSLLRRTLKQKYRKNQRINRFNTLKKLLSGRTKIINVLNGVSTTSTINTGGSNSYTMHQQIRRICFRELSDIKHLVGDDSDNSSDSNYQEGPPARLSKKQRRNLAVLQNSLSPEVETITSTLATFSEGIDLSKIALPMSNHFDPTEDMYREMLLSHKRKQKKIEQEKEQIRLDLIKEQIKPAVSLGNEKKRSATSDRSRVKRTKTEEEIVQERQIEVEPISLTADEILMAEEGQAAAAMLLEIMSDVEEKYNNSP